MRSALLQAGHEVACKAVGDLVRAGRPFGLEPSRNPVDGAENRERQKLGVAATEGAALHAVGDELPHAAIYEIAPVDDGPLVRRRQRDEADEERGPVKLVENRMDQCGDEPPEL